jgi:hypothetical protein
MFSADLVSPEDVRRLALKYPAINNFDLSGFKFINIKPVEFKIAETQVNEARYNFLCAWQHSLRHHKIPVEIRSKISKYLDEEDCRPFKILNKITY